MSKVYILSGARTPTGLLDGNLRDYKEPKLGAEAMKLALEQAGVEAAALSEIIAGTAKQTSLPSNLARYAMLEAHLPDTVPAYTVQRQSASGVQAVLNGVWSIKSGMATTILAGGCESMTHIPREIHDARFAFGERTRIIFDPIEAQVAGAQPENLTHESIYAGLVELHELSGGDLNRMTVDSAEKASARAAADYICKLQVRKGKVMEPVEADERDANPNGYAKPADGAAMLLLASEAAAKGKQPLAEILATAVSAGDAAGGGLLGTAAVHKALEKAGADLAKLARIEIVEMHAAQMLATIKALGLDIADKRVNPLGGGLATGSPWGASGAVQLVDLVHGLQSGETGMLLNPAEGGQAICMVVKKM